MIPKIIHYCWFGGNKKPLESVRYMERWKELHEGYEFIEWNENNFDINLIPYAREAADAGKWAFVSDYARLHALYHYGGIYLDTDVELLKSLDHLRSSPGFAGFESRDSVMTAVIGAKRHSGMIYEIMRSYEDRHFITDSGRYDMSTNVLLFTKYFVLNGLQLTGKKQRVRGFLVCPQMYFSPNTMGMLFGNIPKGAYAVHHCFGSWNESSHRIAGREAVLHFIGGKARNILGTPLYGRIRAKEFT